MSYMFKKSELEVLEKGNNKSIKEIAEALGSDESYISRVVKELEEKSLVEAGREKRKIVHLKDNKVVELYKEIIKENSHMDFPELLKGKGVPVIYCLNEMSSVSEIVEKTSIHRRSVYRVIKRLLHRGVIKKEGSEYQLKEEFMKMGRFAREYLHHLHKKKSDKDYTILWESFDEFLIQTSEKIEEEGFLLTGPELFKEYGIPLLVKESTYYFYTEEKKEVTPSELVSHMLLIDGGTRYQSYCLLLIKKEGIDGEKLIEEARKYGVVEKVRLLIRYLETGGKEKTLEQPKWLEMEKLAREYGVKL